MYIQHYSLLRYCLITYHGSLAIGTKSLYAVSLTRTRVFRALFSISVAGREGLQKMECKRVAVLTLILRKNIWILGFIFCHRNSTLSHMSTRTAPYVFVLLCQSEFAATVTKGTHAPLCQFITPLDTLSVNFFFTKKIILTKKKKFPEDSISIIDISGLMVF